MNESDEELDSINAVGDRLLNIEQLAQILGVKVSTIHDWRYRGSTALPLAVKLGSTLRWRASDVRKFLDDLKSE